MSSKGYARGHPPDKPTATLFHMTAQERLANRDLDVASVLPASPLPDRARVVIVGGGIIGASIAYHLTRAGERDVVLLERGRLTNGTTWHAAGLVSRVRGTHALTALTRDNAATYERVARETGVEVGLRQVGALTIARTEARMQEILAGVGMARDFDIPVEVTDRARIRELWPSAVVDDLVGGVLFPTDATVNPGDAALAFAKGAVDGGARYVPETEVTGFRFAGDGRGRVVGLDTSRGPIEAETVVLAAGLWTSELARLAGASVALYPAEHVWVMTDEAPGARRGRAVPARPRRLPLHPPLPWPVRHRRVRAERQADRAIGGAIDRLRRVRAGLGPLRAGARRRAAAGARARVDRLRALPAGAGELHARLELPARVRARGRRAVRRGGAQLAGDHLRAGRRPGRGRVDRRGAPDDGPRRGRRRADGALDEPAGVAARADGRVAGRAVRAALAGEAAADRAGRAARAAVRRISGGRGGVRAGRGLGAGELVRAGRRGPRGPLRLRRRRRGSRRCARRSGRPARASRCTTSRRTRSSSSRARVRSRRCSGWRRPTWTCRWAGSSTRCCATSAAGSRWTRRSPVSPRIGSSSSPRP